MKSFKEFLLENVKLPVINVPSDNSDLKIIYDFYNKSYFSGSLPKLKLKFVPLAVRFFGKTHVVWDNNFNISKLLITIAKSIRKDKEQLINTMLHEMIHVWQYIMVSKTNDRKYADDTFSFFASGEVNLRGHREYFSKWANKLNNKGHSIKISSGQNSEIDMTTPFFAIHFTNDGNSSTLLRSTKDPTNNIDSVIKEVQSRMGNTFYKDYIIFKSTAQQLMSAVPLTKSFRLPKNILNIEFDKSQVEKLIIKSKFTTILSTHKLIDKTNKTNGIITSSNIPDSIVQILPKLHKNRGKSSLSGYISTVFFNIPEFRNKIEVSMGVDFSKGIAKPELGVTKSILDFIIADYNSITDIEIKRSKALKNILIDIKYDLIGVGADNITQDEIDTFKKKIKEKYVTNFKGRVDVIRFKRLVYEFLSSKFKERYGDNNLADLIFKDLELKENKILKFKDIVEGITESIDEQRMANIK